MLIRFEAVKCYFSPWITIWKCDFLVELKCSIAHKYENRMNERDSAAHTWVIQSKIEREKYEFKVTLSPLNVLSALNFICHFVSMIAIELKIKIFIIAIIIIKKKKKILESVKRKEKNCACYFSDIKIHFKLNDFRSVVCLRANTSGDRNKNKTRKFITLVTEVIFICWFC